MILFNLRRPTWGREATTSTIVVSGAAVRVVVVVVIEARSAGAVSRSSVLWRKWKVSQTLKAVYDVIV